MPKSTAAVQPARSRRPARPNSKTMSKVKKQPPRARKPLTDAEELAALCSRQRLQLARAGRSLHDQAGPLLSAAGIHLQLLKMDVPAVDARIQEVTAILEQALENVRNVSQELAASPVYRGGLERAINRLAEETAEAVPVDIVVDYEAGSRISREAALELYDAIAAIVRTAIRQGGATEIEIQVRDKPGLSAKIVDNGRGGGRAKALMVPRMLAEQSGLKLDISTGKSTIVSVRTSGH